VIPAGFEYHRPGSVDEALTLLERYGEDGRPLAGGHSLIPMMKLRLAEPAHLIDLQALDELKGVREVGGNIVIGAMTTQAELIASAVAVEKCPILREAALLIADPQVRALGTVGGNVANGDPGNDMPALMVALGASYVLRGGSGERVVAADGFYRGPYDVDRADNELLTEVRIPTPAAGHGYAYQKLKRKVGDYAIAAAAAIVVLDGGTCSHAAIALTNVAPTPLNAAEAAQALVGTPVDEEAVAKAAALAAGITDPAADLRGPVEYRKHVAGVMARRAVEIARDRAKGG
jgi:carbon-monoxide dehydrogenase medium subunit